MVEQAEEHETVSDVRQHHDHRVPLQQVPVHLLRVPVHTQAGHGAQHCGCGEFDKIKYFKPC